LSTFLFALFLRHVAGLSRITTNRTIFPLASKMEHRGICGNVFVCATITWRIEASAW
jgi:hypothetical protein